MTIVDFGKNTYQYEIDFKFECLGVEWTNRLVEHLHVDKNEFTALGEDQETGEITLAKGEGTAEAPLYQMKVNPDQLVLWAGWQVPYESWKKWRAVMLSALTSHLKTVPTQFVRTLQSTYGFSIPVDRLREPKEVPELAPILDLYKRFVPESLLRRANAFVTFGDEEGRENVQWWFGGATVPDEESIVFKAQRNLLDTTSSLGDVVAAHCERSDELVERFSKGLLTLLISQR